jgi:predicted nucleic acid-binding protein
MYMETNKAGVIIADTSGLVSLFSPDDRNHAEALNAAKRLQHENRDILIPAAVFVEFLNVMGRKAGHGVQGDRILIALTASLWGLCDMLLKKG